MLPAEAGRPANIGRTGTQWCQEQLAGRGPHLRGICTSHPKPHRRGAKHAWHLTTILSQCPIWGSRLCSRSLPWALHGSAGKWGTHLGYRGISTCGDSWKAFLQCQPKRIHKHCTQVSDWVCLSNTAHLKPSDS